MFIEKIIIEDFKGFKGKTKINFLNQKVNVIIGANGSGKTSILDSIAILLQIITNQFASQSSNGKISFSSKEIFIEATKSSLEGHFSNNSRNKIFKGIMLARQQLNNNPKYDFNKIWALINPIKNDIADIYNGVIPIISYYQTGRKIQGGGVSSYTINLSSGNQRNQVYTHQAFNSIIDYKSVLSWYLQQINIQNNEKVKKGDLNYELPAITTVSKAINVFINKLEGSLLSNLKVDKSRYGSYQTLILDKGQIKLEFTQLSAGEKMLIGLVLDIAYKMSIANPMLDNPLSTNGIILIDEIELHLHPKWQMTVLDALSTTFPNIQFIITTHSPLIINHISNEKLIILDNNRVIQGNEIHNTYGQDINSIVEYLMGGLERPKKVKLMIQEIDNLLAEDEVNTKLARKKLEELKQVIQPNDKDIIRLDTLITLEED